MNGECVGSGRLRFSLRASWFLGGCLLLGGIEGNDYIINHGDVATLVLIA